MFQKYFNFLHGVSVNRTGVLGIILTTSSFVTLVILEILRLLGILTNAYIGLVTYLLFPFLFVVGLILLYFGWRAYKKVTGKATAELLCERFGKNDSKAGIFCSKVALTVGILTFINVLFMVGIGFQTASFMDQPVFCGTACHSVMNPEWTTYQDSPHARVRCVDCHVGEGVDALVSSKLNGLWQMISVTFDLLERPIPTPVQQLRPARETCEKCHWPEKFYGARQKSILHYELDLESTPKYSMLVLKVDAEKASHRRGIHWHIAEANKVRYASDDDKREEILWVEVGKGRDNRKRYQNQDLNQTDQHDVDVRVLDCVDCHNRATHIYENPEEAIDRQIRLGRLDRSLPYLKREALSAITSGYINKGAAFEGIANQIHGFYQRKFPQISRVKRAAIDSAILILQQIYERNIHHGMNITWGSYPSHIGHTNTGGCFRCHNSELVDEQGNHISYDCTLCHSILADDSDRPFQFLQPADPNKRDYKIHQYLQKEFLDTYNE